MNSPLPARAPVPAPAQSPASPPAERRGWGRRLLNVLVALVVIAVAAAAFVFSYGGMHAIALLGGMSAQLARFYPGLFDAVLVVACLAAAVLREGRWWARLWAWLVLILVLAAIGAADVVNAVHYTPPHRQTEGIVAAAPIVAVLLAFSLLLTMLRQPRTLSRPVAVPPAVTEAIAVLPAPPAAIALPAAPVADPEPPTVPPSPIALAPPTVPAPPVIPARVPAPPTVPSPPLGPTAPPPGEVSAPPTIPVPARESRGIRYAGSTPPQRAWKLADEESAEAGAGQATATRETPVVRENTVVTGETGASRDYWDSEDAGPFAGLVYSARDDQEPDGDDAADQKPQPELDDDAPPFATAPFAPVPRLNRQRSTPVPPTEDDEDEE